MENTCPDFDVVPMKSFDPKLFDWETTDSELKNLDALIITFGLVFNDLHGYVWWSTQLRKGKPADDAPLSEYLGQWAGMTGQVRRLCFALIVEFLKTLNKNQSLLSTPLFKRVIKNLKRETKSHWNDLLNAAKKRYSEIEKDKKLYQLMQEVRSNMAFHYQDVEHISKGYESFFTGKVFKKKSASYEKAYYSIGANFTDSRFYFSDAAADGYGVIKDIEFDKS